MKNYYDGQNFIEIDAAFIADMVDYLNHSSPTKITPSLWVVMNLAKAPYKAGQKKTCYTYDEGMEILKKLGIDHEAEMKARIPKVMALKDAPYLLNECRNCGHPLGWHFTKKKCCDNGCDCELAEC